MDNSLLHLASTHCSTVSSTWPVNVRWTNRSIVLDMWTGISRRAFRSTKTKWSPEFLRTPLDRKSNRRRWCSPTVQYRTPIWGECPRWGPLLLCHDQHEDCSLRNSDWCASWCWAVCTSRWVWHWRRISMQQCQEDLQTKHDQMVNDELINLLWGLFLWVFRVNWPVPQPISSIRLPMKFRRCTQRNHASTVADGHV